ncbi:RDD family protein [Bacillus alkalicellulosilyticus]|uniref:RDD family protein n=1 Tax=Alkalihalobacterium alkalicellulosilyticum TaxID=1912214 RepID=UPI0009983D40|nr:RDD family protein [Bacillus alkalicellulosilyticus]
MHCKNSAGLKSRLSAFLVDALILFSVFGVIFLEVYNRIEWANLNSPYGVALVLYFLLLPMVWRGYTIGKRAVGIRIAKVDGDRVGVVTVLVRGIVAILFYGLTFGIGIIVNVFMVGIRKDNRALHDIITKTYVTTDTYE